MDVLTARVQEQVAVAEKQAALSQNQTKHIQELKEREIRWVTHMGEMLAEVREPLTPRVRQSATRDEEAVGSPTKRKRPW